MGDEPLYVDVSGDAPWDAQRTGVPGQGHRPGRPRFTASKYEASDHVREQRRFPAYGRNAVIDKVCRRRGPARWRGGSIGCSVRRMRW